jgi:branched-chain amino acid transport system permease protein
MSGLLCSAGAIVLSYDRGFSPYGGMTAILLAVVAMIVGGRQTFVGPVIGGLVLGVLREETAYLFAARWQELFTFLLLALFILVKPSGLIGNKGRLEAES